MVADGGQDKAQLSRHLSETPLIDPTARVRESRLGPWTWVGPGCSIIESSFGDYSYAAGDVTIMYSEIGKFCSIASHVAISPGNHPMERVSQHHMTYRRREYGLAETDDVAFFDWRRADGVTLGHDVWVGHAAIILPGVAVSTGAVVAAGAVVTKDVEPYTIVAGVPARPVRRRFTERVSEDLLAIAWWDWPRERLVERFGDFNNLDVFIEKYRGQSVPPSPSSSDSETSP